MNKRVKWKDYIGAVLERLSSWSHGGRLQQPPALLEVRLHIKQHPLSKFLMDCSGVKHPLNYKSISNNIFVKEKNEQMLSLNIGLLRQRAKKKSSIFKKNRLKQSIARSPYDLCAPTRSLIILYTCFCRKLKQLLSSSLLSANISPVSLQITSLKMRKTPKICYRPYFKHGWRLYL